MTTEEIAVSYVQLVSDGKVSEAMQLYHDDAVMIDFEGNEYIGKHRIQQFYERPLPPNFQLIVNEVFRTGDKVDLMVNVMWDGREKPQLMREIVEVRETKIQKFEMIVLES